MYYTSDAGKHWQVQFTNTNPKGFFDSMVFWDSKHGVVLGDPIPDGEGKLKFEVLLTEDGQNWRVGSFNANAGCDGRRGCIRGVEYLHCDCAWGI